MVIVKLQFLNVREVLQSKNFEFNIHTAQSST